MVMHGHMLKLIACMHVSMQCSATAHAPTGLPYGQASGHGRGSNSSSNNSKASATPLCTQDSCLVLQNNLSVSWNSKDQQPTKKRTGQKTPQGIVCMHGLLRQAGLKSTRVSNNTAPQNRGKRSFKPRVSKTQPQQRMVLPPSRAAAATGCRIIREHSMH